MNVSLPPPKRHSDTEFVSTNWTQPLCVSQQFIKTIGKQKLVLPITYRNYLYQQITQIIKSHSHWFSPVIPEELYSQIIHTPSFINVNAKQSGNYTIQMTGLRLLDSSIEPILETFYKEPSPTQTQTQTQTQKVSKSLVSETSPDITPNIHSSSLDNSHITHSTPETSNIKQKLQDENEPDNEDNDQEDEDEDEEQSLSLDYLKDMDDVEEWEPPIENTRILETSSQSQQQEQSSVIIDNEGWIDPDSLIETIEERMRQTQIDLEKLKKLRKLTSQSNQHHSS
jgi:hypothetical protein